MKASENSLLPAGKQANLAGLILRAAAKFPRPVGLGTTSTVLAISGLRAAILAPAFPVFRPVA